MDVKEKVTCDMPCSAFVYKRPPLAPHAAAQHRGKCNNGGPLLQRRVDKDRRAAMATPPEWHGGIHACLCYKGSPKVQVGGGVQEEAVTGQLTGGSRSILASTYAKLDTPVPQSALSQMVQNGWKRAILDIPNITYTFAVDARGATHAEYSQATSDAQLQQLVDHSLHETSVVSKDTGPVEYLAEQLSQRSSAAFDLESPARFFLDAVYFALDSGHDMVTHIGLIGSTQHTFFDGTGVNLCFDKVLRSTVTQLPIQDGIKALPEPDFRRYIPSDVQCSDLSLLTERNLKLFLGSMHTHCMIAGGDNQGDKVRMKVSRHRFSKQETALILAKAKELRVTISQIANLCHYVPLLKRFPADATEMISCATAVNLRTAAGVPDRYHSGSGTSLLSQLSCADLGENICKGRPLSKQDCLSVCTLASSLTRAFEERRPMLLYECMTELAGLDKLVTMGVGKDNAKLKMPTSYTSVCVSDGILDRYIDRHYYSASTGLGLQVLDVRLQTVEPKAEVHGRTSTFDGQLSLALQYNEETAWKQSQVDEMAREWAAAVVFVLGVEVSL